MDRSAPVLTACLPGPIGKGGPVPALFRSPGAVRHSAAAPVPAEGGGRRHRRIGEIAVELRSFPRQRPVQVTVRPGTVLLIAPFAGRAEIVVEDFRASLDAASAAVLVKPGPFTVVWLEGARGLIAHLPRKRLQALASRRVAEPLRMIGANLVVERDEACAAALEALLCKAREQPATEPDMTAADRRFCDQLVATLDRQTLIGGAFVVARSVKRAIDHVRADCLRPCDADALAAVAGVTARTLRDSFRACLGVSLSAYVQRIQLEAVRERLVSGRETRSIQMLAERTGFGSGTAFTRAYQRRFGELPTQSRVRGVQGSGSA